MTDTREQILALAGIGYVLRAMVTNYANGHQWDHLDGEAVTKAADLIDQLLAARKPLEEEIERLKTVPMKYRRMAFNAQLQQEAEELQRQLASLRAQAITDACQYEEWTGEREELKKQLAAANEELTTYKRATDLAYKGSEQETLDKLAAAQARISELEAQGEPVAWMWRRNSQVKWECEPRWDAIEKMAANEMRSKEWEVKLLYLRAPQADVDSYDKKTLSRNQPDDVIDFICYNINRKCKDDPASEWLVREVISNLFYAAKSTAAPQAVPEADNQSEILELIRRLRSAEDEAGRMRAESADARGYALDLERRLRAVPEGWQLVPIKPTEEMHVAAVKAILKCHGNDDFPPKVFAAMLAAAPSPEGDK